METNYTTLKIKKISRFFSKENFLLFLSIGFTLANLLFFLYTTFVVKEADVPAIDTKASQSRQIISLRYKSIDQIPFVVNEIDNFNTHGKDYLDYLKKLNPQIEEKALIKEINQEIFTFYTLNKKAGNKNNYPLSYEELIKTNQQLKNEYNQNLTRYTGYYLKIRYRGYYGERKDEIIKYFNTTDLENLAKEKINQIITEKPDPSVLYPELNNDEEITQLNNQEEAIVFFENEAFEDPPFDDPLFYQYLVETTVNQYTDIYQLATKDPFSNEKEPYAFLVFFIKEKTGENLPLNYLIYQTLNESSYR